MTFRSVLVANRGEIAVRVLRSARDAGLRTVAVYSDADLSAPHVRAADVAVRIGPAPAAESYLSIPALIDAARRTGAEAVHPGYGFLSERAGFARACADAGLVFIGPPAEVIEVMGRKDRARRIAVEADVPVVPAIEETDGDDPAGDTGLARRAEAEVGFPLLVKAAAGGGGKGMRIVREAAALPEALAAARREARSAFGDGTLLIERYVEHGRHIEVQVLADQHGHVLHLFERDCSVQRRHQKVLEEAPASTISAAVRERLTSAAVRLARAVGYVNAGTVEFLASGEDVYFLEMNTRLQVEHPVTELITGHDLVALQLQVAQGEELPLRQEDLTVSGHAIEARVYAEDPGQGFLPQAGTASVVRWPARARVDAALEPGSEVGTWYDPMLAKIIVGGPTREAARTALVAALDDTAILGLTTNVGFLRRLAGSPEYRDAAIDTAWLDRNPGSFPPDGGEVARVAAAWLVASEAVEPRGARDPFGSGDGWRMGGPAAPVVVQLGNGDDLFWMNIDVSAGTVSEGERGWWVRPAAEAPGTGPTRHRLEIDGTAHVFEAEVGPREVTVGYQGQAYVFFRADGSSTGGGSAAASDGLVTAPMPGTMLAVRVGAGQDVTAGEILGVLEAMKMELSLTAPHDGTVTEVGAKAGDRVALGQQIFLVAPAAEQE
ncbi:MAG TPA: biotin carboxylase N-terminal domain-containing protein [Streptosporangiaceae bacterium]|jgi:3-methylcrotonyl-CoA carboxylase alpha subunit/acetyl-CoA/propionyl-CoA carboxylase biotin carboxyl carrier protein|nr:biotin carboxylase N-terminal domain-containing protein [Streptosporangiaceae bacterium]